MSASDDDWRLTDQERDLLGATLVAHGGGYAAGTGVRPRATKTLPTASRKGPQGRVGELGFRGQGLPDEQPVGVVLVRFEAVRDERVEAEKVGGRFGR